MKDNPAARQMAAFLQQELLRRLRATGLFASVLTEPGPDPHDGVLRLEGKITHLSAGPSDAERAFLFTAPVPGPALVGAFGDCVMRSARRHRVFFDATVKRAIGTPSDAHASRYRQPPRVAS